MIRSVRPTDLLALAYFNRKARPNEARTRGNLQRNMGETLPMLDFLEQWLSLEENRHTWICTEARRVAGLISAHNKLSGSLWEIDRLLLAAGVPGEVCTKLLSYVSAVGGEIGMHRVFLRLEAESPLVDYARQAGFFPYQVECLYHWGGHSRPLFAPEVLPRPKVNADDHAVFQLYNAVVPAAVRQAQAMTFQEWRELKDRSQDSYKSEEFVLQKEGGIGAWLQVLKKRRSGEFDLLVHPGEEERIEGLIRFAFSRLGPRSTIHALVPEYQIHLCHILEEYGFSLGAKYSSLVKQLAIPVRQRRLVPVRA